METSNKKVKIKVFESAKKIIVTFLVMGINFGGLSAVLGTSAYFSDMEVSTDNAFNAATLDFAAQHSWSFHPYSTCDPKEEICPGWDLTDTVNLTTAGTLDFQYTISIVNAAETASSTMPLCDYLTVNGVPLETFAFAPVLYSANPAVALAFSLTNNNGLLQDQTCSFDYLIRGWQTDGVAGYGQGFFVEKIIGSSITSDPWIFETGEAGGDEGGIVETGLAGGENNSEGEEDGNGEGELDDENSGENESAGALESGNDLDGDEGGEESGDVGDDAQESELSDNQEGEGEGTEEVVGSGDGENGDGDNANNGDVNAGNGVDMGQATAGGNESAGGGDSGNAGGDGGAGSGDVGQGSGDAGGGIGGGDAGAGGDAGGGSEGGAE